MHRPQMHLFSFCGPDCVCVKLRKPVDSMLWWWATAYTWESHSALPSPLEKTIFRRRFLGLKITKRKIIRLQASCWWTSVWTEHEIKKIYWWVGMQRQMCYVAGQVISDCVQKWGKNCLQCVTLLFCLPSCLPIASNNAAVSRALCVALLYCSWGCPGRFGGTFVLASCSLLLLPVGNHWYSECVFISSPPPPLIVLWRKRKPVKMSSWQRSHSDLRRKFPGFMSSSFCSSVNWKESLLHSYSRVRGPGWGE